MEVVTNRAAWTQINRGEKITTNHVESPLQVALVGSGYWGKNLARNFHALGALSLICDTNEALLAQFRGQYPGVDTCLAFSEVLRRPNIVGVVVATPAETHATLAREAMAAGKHVYVEKPLALDEGEAADLARQAEAAGLVLMVGHLLQYHPVFIRLKELARSGELGRINYIYSNRLNLGKIRREENILWSFAPHDISMILSLADEMPCRVMATGGNYLHREIADVTTTHLEFPSGLKAHVFVSWLHPFKEQKLVVVGDKKMAVFDDTRPWEDKLLLYPHAINWKDHMPVPVKADAERCEIPQAEPLRMECDHFLVCIRNGQKPVTDGEEGLAVLRVLNAAQRSMDRACAVEILPTVMPAREQGYFAHATAVVDEGVAIGEGTRIWHFSHVLKDSSVGRNCNLGQNVVVGPDVRIGNGCKIQNNVSVYKGVTLEDEVFCGPSMVFTNVDNPRAHIRRMDQIKLTLIKKGATLGANCTIVCGNTVGRYAFVGAGAVVTRNVADHAVVYGNPARPMGWVCACGEQLGPDLVCPVCNVAHIQGDSGLLPVSDCNETKGAA